jgi:hypothetical protein
MPLSGCTIRLDNSEIAKLTLGGLEMNDSQNQVDIVNTTDSLEAVSAFKGAKNFLFMIALICLLLTQAIFWADCAGLIDKSAPCDKCQQTCAKAGVCTIPRGKCAGCPLTACKVAEPVTIAAQAAIAVAGTEKAPLLTELSEDQVLSAEETTADVPESAEGPVEIEVKNKFKLPQPNCRQAACIVKSCNFILIITVFLYCVTLFMSINISLIGRLGGINHISRAFLQSLFAMVFLLPWQCCLPNIVCGAIYMPFELLCRQGAADSTLATILYYLRFTGLWAIVLLLLIFAQLRSIRWARATLRRLGMAH